MGKRRGYRPQIVWFGFFARNGYGEKVVLKKLLSESEDDQEKRSLQTGYPYGLFQDLLLNGARAGKRGRACNGPCTL